MVKSPVAGWLGGKRQLAKRIVNLLPEHNCYCEPFAGGAWVLFTKEPSRAEVINDINVELINLYRVLQNHLEEFVRQFRWALVARDEFERLKASEPATLTDIQRAARFYYLQRTCFGGRIANPSFGTSTTAGSRLNLLRIEEELSAIHLRLARVTIERLSFEDCISRYDRPETVFYCDPPYVGNERDYGRGVYAPSDLARLVGQLRQIQGRFILSINDVAAARDLLDEFVLEEASVTYTIANRRTKRAPELIARNFE